MTDDEKLLQATAGANFGPDASLALEDGLRSALKVMFLLVQRLGGQVELTDDELTSVEPTWELVLWTDPVTNGLVAKCRKPTKGQQ